MDLIIVISGTKTLLIFLYKREWLLRKNSFFIIFFIDVFLFAISYVLTQHNAGNSKIIPVLKMPLIAVIIFKIMQYLFYIIYKKNPVNTFWSMDANLMRDGIFNFLYWILSIILPIILIFKVLI